MILNSEVNTAVTELVHTCETWTDLADKWSRFDIASDADGGLYYCQIAYAAETEEDAMAVSADANDLAAGCNGFGWSEIRVKFAYTGTYDDTWGGSHTINAFKWDQGSLLFHVSNTATMRAGWSLRMILKREVNTAVTGTCTHKKIVKPPVKLGPIWQTSGVVLTLPVMPMVDSITVKSRTLLKRKKMLLRLLLTRMICRWLQRIRLDTVRHRIIRHTIDRWMCKVHLFTLSQRFPMLSIVLMLIACSDEEKSSPIRSTIQA